MSLSPITIIIGDATHNTLSVVRSLGGAHIPFALILKGNDETCNVSKSKYVRRNRLFRIRDIEECAPLLESLADGIIICTFDEAAEWVDRHEPELSKKFITPCRGKQIGTLFNKAEQCKLAEECGLTVPKSQLYRREEDIDKIDIPYPIILKPLQSTQGEKSDIHIVHDSKSLSMAMELQSECTDFILQEFIDKEYELDCIGVVTDSEIIVAGAVQKIRHYPHLIGAGAYGIFRPLKDLNIDMRSLERFLHKSHYHGPFSVEFLHTKDNKNYFMEVNFRNEGLAQVATAAGANLHALYADRLHKYTPKKVRSIYMMNYSIDYLHVKEGRVSKTSWMRDFLRTSCFINFSFSDPMPVMTYYLSKLKNVLRLISSLNHE